MSNFVQFEIQVPFENGGSRSTSPLFPSTVQKSGGAFREGLGCLADRTMDPGDIQHNHNVPQCLEGFKKFMNGLVDGNRQETRPEWKFGPVLTLAWVHLKQFAC